jgi:hypothetical protein
MCLLGGDEDGLQQCGFTTLSMSRTRSASIRDAPVRMQQLGRFDQQDLRARAHRRPCTGTWPRVLPHRASVCRHIKARCACNKTTLRMQQDPEIPKPPVDAPAQCCQCACTPGVVLHAHGPRCAGARRSCFANATRCCTGGAPVFVDQLGLYPLQAPCVACTRRAVCRHIVVRLPKWQGLCGQCLRSFLKRRGEVQGQVGDLAGDDCSLRWTGAVVDKCCVKTR